MQVTRQAKEKAKRDTVFLLEMAVDTYGMRWVVETLSGIASDHAGVELGNGDPFDQEEKREWAAVESILQDAAEDIGEDGAAAV